MVSQHRLSQRLAPPADPEDEVLPRGFLIKLRTAGVPGEAPRAAKATRRAGSQAKRLWREEDPKVPQGLKKNRLPGIGPHVDCFVFGLETLDLMRGAGPGELREQRGLFTGDVGGRPTSHPQTTMTALRAGLTPSGTLRTGVVGVLARER